jgi:hypothetical protein
VICEAFAATRVLDISAGWGDRLLGCMACPSVDVYVLWVCWLRVWFSRAGRVAGGGQRVGRTAVMCLWA